MSKTPPGQRPDPMEREVDRLLAQLSRVGGPPAHERGEPREPAATSGAGRGRAAGAAGPATGVRRSDRRRGDRRRGDRRRAELLGLWARVLLGLGLGAAMTQWPYPRACGWPLLGYSAAVAAVVLAGAWIAFTSWKLRRGLPHVVSLLLIYWGLVLAAELLLPRIGYAAEQAAWRCPAAASRQPA
jgi:hypothetical protein